MEMEDQTSQDSGVVEMNNSTSVLHKIANLYAEQLMSDICLVVGDNRYPAHRVILCASSDVFQVMLMNPEWNECRESVIELKEETCCAQVFPQFLKYLYVGQIRISLSTVMPMLALADKYNIKDLVELCVAYMLKHTAKASIQGFLVSWLHYTISFSPYHNKVTQELQNFLKWNLKYVADSKDYLELDVNILIVLLQQNDLVLTSEYELFEFVERYVSEKKVFIDNIEGLTDECKEKQLQELIESLFVHVRFAMMTPSELARLLVRPFIKMHQQFFVDRMGIGMSYHSGHIERVTEIRNSEYGVLQFTPRLYTTDSWGLAIAVEDFEHFENFQPVCACFFSQSNLSEYQDDQNITWNVDFFPRGVKYNRAKLINVYYNMQAASYEIPETILKTVRLRVTCTTNLEGEQRFMVGVLVYGLQNQISHIRTVHYRTQYFSMENRVLNIDNILPWKELEMSSILLSPHLIGQSRNTLSIQVIIAPMGSLTCHETPIFDFK